MPFIKAAQARCPGPPAGLSELPSVKAHYMLGQLYSEILIRTPRLQRSVSGEGRGKGNSVFRSGIDADFFLSRCMERTRSFNKSVCYGGSKG